MTAYLYTDLQTTLGFATLAAGDTFTVSSTGSLIDPNDGIVAGPGASGLFFRVAGELDISRVQLVGGDFVSIAATGSVYSTTTGALFLLGDATGSTQFDNAGSITALAGVGVIMANGGNSLHNSGTISGLYGVELGAIGGADHLVNSGEIFGRLSALLIDTGGEIIQNDGALRATDGAGIEIDGDFLPATTETITNTGTISTDGFWGILCTLGTTGSTLTITNSGTISGGLHSIGAGGESADHIVNTGTLNGSVNLFNGNDTYIGTGGVLNGDAVMGAGNDTFDLRGGVMNGTVYGGAGQDSYYVDDANTRISEDPGAEADAVFAATSFHLADNVEYLVLLEAGNFNGTGNASANLLAGNSGDNRLNGLDGTDTLFGNAGNDRLSGGNQGDQVNGDDGDDTLQGNLGNDKLKGGDGDDVLNGGAGKDVLTGNTGADVFVFSALTHSVTSAATEDTITDFTQGDDVINLAAIDANHNNAASNDAFTFFGAAAFTGVAGQLHDVQSGGDTFVEMDANGDSVADSVIRLNGLYTLNASDFVL